MCLSGGCRHTYPDSAPLSSRGGVHAVFLVTLPYPVTNQLFLDGGDSRPLLYHYHCFSHIRFGTLKVICSGPLWFRIGCSFYRHEKKNFGGSSLNSGTQLTRWLDLQHVSGSCARGGGGAGGCSLCFRGERVRSQPSAHAGRKPGS